jgi:hypothetical protein
MKFNLTLFSGALVGSLLLVYYRLSNPAAAENGTWHGMLIVLICLVLAELICRFIFQSLNLYRKVLLGVFIVANLGAVPARIVTWQQQMNSEAAFVLHFQGVFGALYGMSFVVLLYLLWQYFRRPTSVL